MLPNPDADLSDNSIVRKRDFLDHTRKGHRTAPTAHASAANVPAFLRPSMGKRKLSPWIEISAAADTERSREAASQAEQVCVNSAPSKSQQPQCFAVITNTVAAQLGASCRVPSRFGSTNASQPSSGSTGVHSAAAATKGAPTAAGERRPRREPAALLDYSE